MTAKRKPTKRAVTKKAAVKQGKPASTLVIEPGVPIPPRRSSAAGELSSTLRALNVGDSFEVDLSRRRSVFPTAIRLGLRVATRTTENGKLRVWLLGYRD